MSNKNKKFGETDNDSSENKEMYYNDNSSDFQSQDEDQYKLNKSLNVGSMLTPHSSKNLFNDKITLLPSIKKSEVKCILDKKVFKDPKGQILTVNALKDEKSKKDGQNNKPDTIHEKIEIKKLSTGLNDFYIVKEAKLTEKSIKILKENESKKVDACMTDLLKNEKESTSLQPKNEYFESSKESFLSVQEPINKSSFISSVMSSSSDSNRTSENDDSDSDSTHDTSTDGEPYMKSVCHILFSYKRCLFRKYIFTILSYIQFYAFILMVCL